MSWVGSESAREKTSSTEWTEVVPGVLQSPGWPRGYALVAGDRALLIDAPCGADGLKARGIKTIDAVLLTHHHRDTAASNDDTAGSSCEFSSFPACSS